MWTAARLVSMTPPAGREATPLPASPSTWPSKEPSTTTTGTILLQPGQHQLHGGSETQLRNMSQLAIVDNGSEGEPVVITCQPLAGLAFLWSTNITLSNLRLIGCGKLQNRNNECENNHYKWQYCLLAAPQ